MDSILQLTAVTKVFPGVKALDSVSFDVAEGEVHSLVGENGAGKSTLIKILGGVFAADSGKIIFGNKQINFRSTHQSQLSGISVIFQEFNLLPDLSVAENIYIGREPKKGPFIDWRKITADSEAILKQLGVEIDPKTIVEGLSVAEKQMVEIAKALSFKAKLIIMDEPTAALSEREAEKLFEIVRTLKLQGAAILFVSHRLKEVFAVSDRITVLRDGRFIATKDVRQTDEEEIIRFMVGRDIKSSFAKNSGHSQAITLSVRNLNFQNSLKNISFDVRRGQILGVAGLMGCGKTQLAEALYGLLPIECGEITLDGRQTKINSPRKAIEMGIGFVSEERKENGVFPGLSVLHNLTITIIGKLSGRLGIRLNFQKERDTLTSYTNRLDIRYHRPQQEIDFLSGGNQQKVLLARALASDCKLLILCEPTRGIDVGAKAEIHSLMNELAKKGVAIIMISSDLPEVISMSDRCITMYRGRITGYLSKEQMTETNIVACAVGQKIIGSEN
jgi:ABC-type sugar transport system ATPase subunit